MVSILHLLAPESELLPGDQIQASVCPYASE